MGKELKKFYVETGYGSCIKEGYSANEVKRRVLKEVGSRSGVNLVREATPEDIAWVKSMGGNLC